MRPTPRPSRHSSRRRCPCSSPERVRRSPCPSAAVAAGEAELETRIEALERERLPEPAKFREEQLAKMAGAIEESVRRVTKRAQNRLRERCTQLEREWLAAIESATDRAAVASTLAQIDATVAARVQGLLEGIGDDIGSEMQSTSEVLEVWALEDVRHQRQHVNDEQRQQDEYD